MTELADLDRLLTVAMETGQRATGRQLQQPDIAAWPSAVDDEDSFRHLVSAASVWLRELWPAHLNFFRSSAAPAVGRTTRELRIVDGNVNHLRTSQVHRLDPKVARDAKILQEVARWMRAACGSDTPSSSDHWRACGQSLLSELEGALREFIGIARAVGADAGLVDQWRQCFAAEDWDLVAVRQEIAGDLGLALHDGDAAYLDRRIKQAWDRAASRSSRSSSPEPVRSVVARELVGWSTPELPCDLEEVLTHLDIDPGRGALGAVRLVHAVAEIVDFDTSGELLDVVAEIWRKLTERDGL